VQKQTGIAIVKGTAIVRGTAIVSPPNAAHVFSLVPILNSIPSSLAFKNNMHLEKALGLLDF